MDNEKNEALNEKVQQAKDDVSAKIADAASEIKEEIEAADMAVEEAADEVISEVNEVAAEAANEVKKTSNGVNLSVGALVGVVVGCIAVAALAVFLIMNYVSAQPKYGKAEGKAVATINGEKLTDADMGYYIYTEATNQYYEVEGDNADGNIEGYDWDQEIDGRKLSDIIKENAYNNAINEFITAQKTDEVLTGDMAWDEEDDKQIESTVDSYVKQFGEDGFNLRAKSMGITSANEYARMYARVMKAQDVQYAIEEDLESYIPEGVDLSEYTQSDKVSAKHILLMVNDPMDLENVDPDAYDDASALALATTIAEQLKAGEDFDTLMEQYNQDTGETTAGYTFGTGEMVPEFEEAAFALKLDEISDPVKTDYGYHVIKRIAGFYELQGYWRSQAKISENSSVLNNISVKGIMDGVFQSGQQIQAEQAAAAAE